MAFCKNRDPRDMLAELIEAGICKKLQPCTMKDFIGEANLIGSNLTIKFYYYIQIIKFFNIFIKYVLNILFING